MNPWVYGVSWLIAAVLVSPGRAEGLADNSWQAGTARICITPDQPMWLSGYAARNKPADGKLHDLWAKALALQDPTGRRAVLLTLDLVGVERELSLTVCNALQKQYGLPREAVVLACSHTHSGPVVRSNLNVMYNLDATQQKYVADYAASLQSKLVTVVGEALKGLAPARLSWGNGLATLAVNRRNNKEADVPRLRATGQLQGPVDHELPVLAIRDPAGKLRAVVFGYACHATVLDGYQWCGDYPGYAQIELEQAYPEAVALFWAGCGGDQNPVPRRSVALAEAYGRQLAERVADVLQAPMHSVQGMFAAAYRELDLPFADLPSREQLVQASQSANRYEAARARLLLQHIEAHGSLRGTYPYPVQAWRLGHELLFVALGGEVVVDYSLRLKRELGPGRTWVASYANDVMAYIPSRRVLQEGGYEGSGAMVYYGLPTVWGPQVEELIVAAVHEEVGKVRSPGGKP